MEGCYNKMRKKLVAIVIILCTLVFSVCFANDKLEYILEKVNYTLFINDIKYENEELPILNYLGNTYVPLRILANTCGTSVDWREDTNSVVMQTLEENTPYLNENIYLEDSDERQLVLLINESIKYHNEKDIDKSMSLFSDVTKDDMKDLVQSYLDDGELVKNKIMDIRKYDKTVIFLVRGLVKTLENNHKIWSKEYVFEKENEQWKLFDIH